MARDLNKTRMRNTRILMSLTILAGIFSKTLFPDETPIHESMDFLGYVLVTVCAVGRVYTTAFIGGVKNEKLVTWGPYSLCRNPLYFFSLCGAAGIGLMSTSLLALVVIFGGFFLIYISLIGREEMFLSEKFGADFASYKENTPRLWPSFRAWHYPEEMTCQPKFLNNAVRDAIWWFVPYPVFELAEWLQEVGIVPVILHIF